jgi:RimJ/RimL family protein N-acetyltransferase
MGNDCARPYIVYLDEDPFGYIQYYYASEGDPNWWPDEPGQDVIGIDQFIADENSLGKGFGTLMITQFIRYLTNHITISEIRVDPRPDNLRAICCYEKIGFRKIQNIITPDGPAIMMTLDRCFFSQKSRRDVG